MRGAQGGAVVPLNHAGCTNNGAASEQTTRTVVFLLVEGVSMMSLASGVEPLRSLNRLIGRDAWRWRLASLDGAPVEASNGIPLATVAGGGGAGRGGLSSSCAAACASSPWTSGATSTVLRQAVRAKIAVGSLSTGTYLLARAGLLDGYRCTIHWENRPAFQEEFPELTCTDKLFEIDRDRLTCSGGVAAMDMMLHLIAERHGGDLARGWPTSSTMSASATRATTRAGAGSSGWPTCRGRCARRSS